MSKKKKKIFKNKFHNNGVQSLKEEIVNINKNTPIIIKILSIVFIAFACRPFRRI